MKRSITPRIRALLIAVVILVVVVIALIPRPAPVTGFALAKAQGWSIAPVRVIHMQPRWLRFLQPVPPNLSPTDIAVIRACWVNPSHLPPYNKHSAHMSAIRNRYLSVIARYPGNFYPERCLAEWYYHQRDMAQYNLWEQRALQDAPAVIAGKVVDESGKPVAGATYVIQMETYQPSRFQNSHGFDYVWMTMTDRDGCYYIPVFRGIYVPAVSAGLRFGCIWNGQGQVWTLYYPGPELSDYLRKEPSGQISTGIVTVAHVGVLPTVIARQPMRMLSPSGPVASRQFPIGQPKPVELRGDELDFHWTPVPGATNYRVQVEDGSMFFADVRRPEWKLQVNGPELQRQSINSNNPPVLNRYEPCGLGIFAYKGTDQNNPSAMLNMMSYSFIPLSAPPIPLTLVNFQRALGPQSTISSFKKVGKSTTVTGTCPVGTINAATMGRKFEPLFGQYDPQELGGNFSRGEPSMIGADDRGEQTFSVTITPDEPESVEAQSPPWPHGWFRAVHAHSPAPVRSPMSREHQHASHI